MPLSPDVLSMGSGPKPGAADACQAHVKSNLKCLRLLFGTPVCALADHDPVLRHDATLGWFEVCRRCGCARLLSPAQTG